MKHHQGSKVRYHMCIVHVMRLVQRHMCSSGYPHWHCGLPCAATSMMSSLSSNTFCQKWNKWYLKQVEWRGQATMAMQQAAAMNPAE